MIKELLQKKTILEQLYAKYDSRDLVKPDPLQFAYNYKDPLDVEIVAFLASALAYGRVEQIEKSLTRLFDIMGKSPSCFVGDFGPSQRKKLSGFKHRFTTGNDISNLLILFRQVLKKHGSLEQFFVQYYNPGDNNVLNALTGFCGSLYRMHIDRSGNTAGQGIRYLLTSPTKGSACKRLNLFLRWVVRNDNVDLGLWKSVDKAKLIVPVDVHMARLCKILGLYNRRTVSLATAVEITESFAKIEPSDPVKYDFSLSRIGILDDCNGRYRIDCEMCQLLQYCLQQENWMP